MCPGNPDSGKENKQHIGKGRGRLDPHTTKYRPDRSPSIPDFVAAPAMRGLPATEIQFFVSFEPFVVTEWMSPLAYFTVDDEGRGNASHPISMNNAESPR
jgi:hypothetical protein